MSERVKFYMDEHIHPAITAGLRLRGIDVLTAQDVRMLGIRDSEHLAFATRENRVLFTHDDDFLKLHAQGILHAGIAFTHQKTTIGRAVRGLVLLHEVLSADDMVNSVEFL